MENFNDIDGINIDEIEFQFLADEEDIVDAYFQRYIEQVDYRNNFETNLTFDSKDELRKWVQQVGYDNKMVIVTKRSSDKYIYLICERGGNYRRPKTSSLNSASKKQGCMFEIRGSRDEYDRWVLCVVNGFHNHDMPIYLEGHPYVGRLSSGEKDTTLELSRCHVRPQNILLNIKDKDRENVTSQKQVYNTKYTSRVEDMEGRSVLQQMFKMVSENHYYFWYEREIGTDVVTDILYCHPKSIDLLRAFPYVLVMDCTYKTNKYGMPFLEIIGIASTGQNFDVGFAYMTTEKESSYRWALSKLRTLFRQDMLPVAIVTDMDQALVNAVGNVFPETTHLLCRRHILTNIETKVLRVSRNKGVTSGFITQWNSLVESSNEETYDQRLVMLKEQYKNMPQVLSYVKETWLHRKVKFVSAWTDRVMHLGTHTTNRVETAHSRLKRFLASSRGSFDTIFRRVHSLLELQHSNIKEEFEKSRTRVPHFANNSLYFYLKNRVSHKALNMIEMECERAKANTGLCGCSMRTIYGLPCAHELGPFIFRNVSIPLSGVHSFWTILHMESQDFNYGDSFMSNQRELLYGLVEEICQKPASLVTHMIGKVAEIVHPQNMSMEEPTTKRRGKGRPRKNSTAREPSAFEYARRSYPSASRSSLGTTSRGRTSLSSRGRGRSSGRSSQSYTSGIPFPYCNEVPSIMVPFISTWHDVEGDGNCGYRAIASSLYDDQDLWNQVRMDCFMEIRSKRELYGDVFQLETVQQIMQEISHYKGSAPQDKWMRMPNMGHVIATRYNVVLVHLSAHMSLT